ncbi:MAG: hypothetical protein AABZ60_19740 [Planctomycetota bacterium]
MQIQNYQEFQFLQFCRSALACSSVPSKKQKEKKLQSHKILLPPENIHYFLNQASYFFLVYSGGFFQKEIVRSDQRLRGRMWDKKIRPHCRLQFSPRSLEILTFAYQFHLETLKDFPKGALRQEPKSGDILIGYLIKRYLGGRYSGEEPLWELLHGGTATFLSVIISPHFRGMWNYLDGYIAKCWVQQDKLLWASDRFEEWQTGHQKRLKQWNKLIESFLEQKRYTDLAVFLKLFEQLFRLPETLDDHQIRINRFLKTAKKIHQIEHLQNEIATFYEIGERLKNLYQEMQHHSYVERNEEENLYMEMYHQWYHPIEPQVSQLYRTLTRVQG